MMIYTQLTKKALKLSFEAHKNQVDKTGMPYVFHPFYLAEQMTDEISTVCALLHDVIEDTEYTFEDMQKMGFPQEVIDVLKLLTRENGVPYMEYVEKIKENPIAKQVKLADLKHNSDLTRMDVIDESALQRAKKYSQARESLQFFTRENIMPTKYYLNQDKLPTIPTPHDCVVTAVEYNSEFLTLKFEGDISDHDSIKTINPNAKSLVIRIHLFDPTFDTYKRKSKLSLLKGEGFLLENNDKLFKKRFKPMQYLAHYVAYNSIIIELFRSEYVVLKIESDFVEFEWIEE